MTMPYYRLMGQIFVASKTWHSIPDVRETMSKVGLTKDKVDRGLELVDTGEQLVARRRDEAGGDRIAFHSVHQAANEVEMWLQTAKFNLRDRIDDEAVMERAVNHGLHSHDHTVTVIAGTLRTLGVLRTEPAIEEAFSRTQSLHDLIVRGQTLVAKLLDCTEVFVADAATARPSEVFSQLRDHQRTMDDWVVDFARACENVKDQPRILGLTGYLPEGVGLPAGGTSFAVPLHKRAKREAPDPDEAGSTSGWSVGRQGRNRENLGAGFVEPTFE